jgi:MFS family permease
MLSAMTQAGLETTPSAIPEETPAPERSVASRGAVYLAFLVLMLAAAGFYDSYATTFRYKMITYVRADMDVELAGLLGLNSIIYLASCLAFIPTLLADVVGRKPVFLVTMTGLCVLQWLVGFAQTPLQYIGLLAVLAFFYKSDIWLIVMSEEAMPRHRGLLTALVVLLSGSAALVLGELVRGMGDEPGAWRAVAKFPIYGIVLVIPIALFMRETNHFRDMKSRRTALIDWRVIGEPFRRGFLRFLMVVSSLKMLLAGGVIATVTLIETDFLRVENGFSREIIGRLIQWDVVATVAGWLLAGFLSDRLGRRRVFYMLCILYSTTLILFALLPRGSTSVMVFSVLHNLASTGAFAILRVATVELFPSTCRSTAAGWTDLFTTLFAAVNVLVVGWVMAGGGLHAFLEARAPGLDAWLEGWLFTGAEHGMSKAAVIVAAALTIPLLMPLYRLLPETRARRLEEI